MNSDNLGFGEPIPHTNLEFALCLGMAIYEKTGMRRIIARNVNVAREAERARLEKERERIASEGGDVSTVSAISEGSCLLETSLGVKALLGTMFRESGKSPLYRVSAVYVSSPMQQLFGCNVKTSTLSDRNLGRCLDEVFLIDMKQTLVDCYHAITGFYGIKSRVLHLDHTDYFLWGEHYADEGDGAAIPDYSGHEKSNMNNNLQKDVSGFCDEFGITLMTDSFDGNTSDVAMNRSMLTDLKRRIGDISDYIVVGDCKLATARLVKLVDELKAGFITKVPVRFNSCMKSRILSMYRESDLVPVEGRHGMTALEMTDTLPLKDRDIPLRVVVFRHNGALEASRHVQMDRVRKAGESFDALTKCDFPTIDELHAAVKDLEKRYKGLISVESYTHMTLTTDNRPTYHLVGGKIVMDYARAEELARQESLTVLMSNVTRTGVDEEDPRKGISTATLIRYYLEEDRIEKNFSMLKSGERVNHMFIETLKRQDAVIFIASLATMISQVVNKVLKDNRIILRLPSMRKMQTTMRHISNFMARTLIEYDSGRISIGTYPESMPMVIDIMDSMKLEAKDLFDIKF